MQVVTDVDEADIAGIEEGQRATFTVDAYPNDTFEGVVTQIRLGQAGSSSSSSSTTSSTTVVTYEVVIAAHNPDLKLKPRLTANVTIYTLDRKNVLSVPARALRFTPEKPLIGDKDIVKDCESEYKLWTQRRQHLHRSSRRNRHFKRNQYGNHQRCQRRNSCNNRSRHRQYVGRKQCSGQFAAGKQRTKSVYAEQTGKK